MRLLQGHAEETATTPGAILNFTSASRPRRMKIAAFSLVMVAGLALSGCANPFEKAFNDAVESQIGGGVDKLIEKATDGKVQGFGSATVPSDFPESVPLPDGEPTNAIRLDDDDKVSWMLHYKAPAGISELDAMSTALESRGFVKSVEGSGSFSDAVVFSAFTNDVHRVNLGLIGEDDDGILQIMVFPAADE